jgi:ribose 5-phosphate isomerase B
MRIVAGSDHAGLELKGILVEHLRVLGHVVQDVGTHTAESCDYPAFAADVASAITEGQADWGLLCCGTGVGMSIAANKMAGIRAAVVSDTFSARMARLHNAANVLCLGQRVVGAGLAQDIVSAWLDSTFEGGRHQRRVDLLTNLDRPR